MLQARLGRCGKQEQEQNSPNLKLDFEPSSVHLVRNQVVQSNLPSSGICVISDQTNERAAEVKTGFNSDCESNQLFQPAEDTFPTERCAPCIFRMMARSSVDTCQPQYCSECQSICLPRYQGQGFDMGRPMCFTTIVLRHDCHIKLLKQSLSCESIATAAAADGRDSLPNHTVPGL